MEPFVATGSRRLSFRAAFMLPLLNGRPAGTFLLLAGIGLWALAAACGSEPVEDPRVTAWQRHHRAGTSAFRGGRYAEADTAWQRALAAAGVFPEEDPRLHRTLDDLAGLCVIRGRNAHAESLYTHLLALQEKQSPRGRTTAATLAKLADLYQLQGRLVQAESLYVRLLAFQEEDLEKRDPAIASTLGKLAGIYRARNQFVEADSLDRRSLGIKLHSQGYAHFVQGRNRQAETFYQRALDIQEKTLGGTHPDLARTCADLARLYEMEGDEERARAFSRRATAR